MIQEIYNALNPNGYLVSIAVTANNQKALTCYEFPTIANYVDFINLVKKKHF